MATYKIPFHPTTGEMFHRNPGEHIIANWKWDNDKREATYDKLLVDWKENYEFETTLTYQKLISSSTSGRSFIFKDDQGKTFYMFHKDFDDMMAVKGFQGNKLTGKFTFVKRGDNFGVKLIG